MDDRLQSKFIPFENLASWADKIRAQGLTIATLNGSFDLLHSGHLYILEEAARHGDVLIVGLNSDASIAAYKSKDRPIIPLNDRLRLIAALACVSAVTYFEQTTPCELIERIKPDIHVNGSEYGTDCVEAASVEKVGAKLILIPRVDGLSTSAIIAKILKVSHVG